MFGVARPDSESVCGVQEFCLRHGEEAREGGEGVREKFLVVWGQRGQGDGAGDEGGNTIFGGGALLVWGA